MQEQERIARKQLREQLTHGLPNTRGSADRGFFPDDDDEIVRARAARAILVDARAIPDNDLKEAEVAAFIEIFHPDRVLPKGQRYTDG